MADNGATEDGGLSTNWLVGQKWENTDLSAKTLGGRQRGNSRERHHEPPGHLSDKLFYVSCLCSVKECTIEQPREEGDWRDAAIGRAHRRSLSGEFRAIQAKRT
jgi:hypothetical protein